MSAPAAQPTRLSVLRRRAQSMLRDPDTRKAAGLAAAMIVNNVIALGSTFVFARVINDYGSLAALVSYLIILTVAGQAMQLATAREGVLGHLGVGEGLIATVDSWTKTMAIVMAVLTVVSIALQHPIADLVGVPKDSWAAAVGLPAACLYLEVSLLRGALQGIGDYRSVGISLIGEQGSRLVLGTILAVAGLSVTGAYLGSLLSYVAMSAYCMVMLRRRVLGERARVSGAVVTAALSLWMHVKRAWAPIVGLIEIALLQNVDIIAAKHRFTSDLASSYGATAVAAKVLIWVAMGAGFYLVPEVSRRRSEGQDTRPVLGKSLLIIAVCAVPVLLIFAVAAEPLIRIAFGAKRTGAADALLPLGLAFTVLSCTYLAVQYMLALKRTKFLIVIGAVAIAEPIFLLQASQEPRNFAFVVLGVQVAAAILAFAMALRPERPAPRARPDLGQAGITPEESLAAQEHLTV
jgi:O-antigen/teichoic acid export membrane protein